MKKLLIIIFVFIFCQSTSAWGPEFIGIKSDKYMHAASCYGLTHWLESKDGLRLNWWQSFLAINSLGAVKEFSDTKTGGAYDQYDIMANNVGWLLKHIQIRFNF